MIATGSLRKKLLDLAVSGKLVPRTGEWRTVKLGDVADVIKDGEHKTPRRSPLYSGYYLLSARNILDCALQLDDVDYVDGTEFEMLSKRCHPLKGDVLISCSGSVGRVCIADADNYVMVRSAAMVRVDSMDSKYLMYALQSPSLQRQINKRKKQTAQANLFLGEIAELIIPLPLLEEQKRIVARLEELLALEREIAADGAALDDLVAAARRKILDLAVSGKLVPRQGEWRTVKLGDVCEYGKCNSVEPSNIPLDAWVLDLEDIQKGTGILQQRVSAKERKPTSSKHAFTKGTLLYSKLRTYLNKVLIAHEDGFCTSEILPLVFDDRVLPEYARFVLMSPMFLAYTATCCYGVKMPRLGTGDGKKGPFPLPPLAEQKAIVKRVDELMALLDAMKG